MNPAPLNDRDPRLVSAALRVVGAALVADLARQTGASRDEVLTRGVAHAEAIAQGRASGRFVDGLVVASAR